MVALACEIADSLSADDILAATDPAADDLDVGGEAGDGVSGWPRPGPLPNKLPDVPAFSLDLLPRSVAPWIGDISEQKQCPPEFAAVSAMVALGSLVAKYAAIQPKEQDNSWTPIPNLWGIVVGQPGVLKSPAMKDPMDPLLRMESAAAEDYEERLRGWQARQTVAAANRSVMQEDFKKSIKKGDSPEDLAKKLLDVAEDPEPVRTRMLVNDCTVEALTEIQRGNPGGLCLFRDELSGFLYQLEREGQETARSYFLEAWEGGRPFETNRIGRGSTRVQDNTVSIIGSIQPGPLRSFLRRGAPGRQDDGLIQRYQLAVWPDLRRDWRYVDRPPDQRAREEAYGVYARIAALDIEALVAMGAQVLAPDSPHPRAVFRFAPDAQADFIKWLTGLEARIRSDGEDRPAFIAHLAKYRSLVPSIALIIHLAEGGDGPVSRVALIAALAWAEYLEKHALRIYAGLIGADAHPAHALARKITSRVVTDGFRIRDVYRHSWAELSERAQVEQAAAILEDLGWLRSERQETAGRPGYIYRVNPFLFSSKVRAA